ncbi:MAG: aldo/keto reductase [Candidatus Dormibacteraeota bacterium]|nr:aldo/keto reductase [Candidatus Dormibacteraeota bacterium]
MSTDDDSDEPVALETIAAAVEAGVTIFDTARAYTGGVDELGHNERLLARALRACDGHRRARIVSKGGMGRPDGAWIPDGRAKTILSDCEASLAALGGLPIDLYLIHAPDPRTPWRTSVRALARLVAERLVARVGLANVNRHQLDEALDLAPITAVQVALSPYDDSAVRGGLVAHCAEMGIAVIAHSPLGGPRRARGLARHPPLAEVAGARGVSPAEVALAWLLTLSPSVVAIPGARRPQTARSAAHAASVVLDARDRALLAGAFASPRQHLREPARLRDDADVVLVMGIPGAGKSRVAEEHVARGYLRLNRDERGGSLRKLAGALESELASGVRHVVLDNTWLTRAARSDVVDSATRHRIPTRCVWIDIPLAQAQVNVVHRILERFGALPAPDELRALSRRVPGIVMPTAQMRALRELEHPHADERFAAVEHMPFHRDRAPASARRGVFVAASALRQPGWAGALDGVDRTAPHLVFDWRPDGSTGALRAGVARVLAEVSGPVEGALCPHPAGPPMCWCRPPLPGLPLAFARAHDIDPALSTVVGTGAAHRTLAVTLGARFVHV